MAGLKYLQARSFLLVTVIIPCNILRYSLQDVEFSRIAEIVIPLSTDPYCSLN